MVGGGACMAGETASAADGTHPTGMYSFCVLNILNMFYKLFQEFGITT